MYKSNQASSPIRGSVNVSMQKLRNSEKKVPQLMLIDVNVD